MWGSWQATVLSVTYTVTIHTQPSHHQTQRATKLAQIREMYAESRNCKEQHFFKASEFWGAQKSALWSQRTRRAPDPPLEAIHKDYINRWICYIYTWNVGERFEEGPISDRAKAAGDDREISLLPNHLFFKYKDPARPGGTHLLSRGL